METIVLRSLFALLALAAVTFANCAVYAKEQLPKLCMIRAEHLRMVGKSCGCTTANT